MKTNIKLRVTPKQSIAVQKICFANDIDWNSEENKIPYTVTKYLFIEPTGIWFREIADHNKGSATLGYTEVDADLFIRTNGTCVESIEECQFAKYGFEKHEDCVILTKVGSWLIGYVKNGTQAPKPAMWFEYDGSSSISTLPNLQPIKKHWYETCKFPVLVWDTFADKLEVATEYTDDALYLLSDIRDASEVRPLSNDEIDQLKQDF